MIANKNQCFLAVTAKYPQASARRGVSEQNKKNRSCVVNEFDRLRQ